VRQWNEVDPRATLQDGLFLQLFVPSDFDTSRAVVLTPDEVRVLVMGSEEFYEHHVRQEGRVRLRYRVREGDSLSSIANRFGITIGSMCRINVMPRDAVLAIGQELIVYTTPERVPADLRTQIEPDPAPPVPVPDSTEPVPVPDSTEPVHDSTQPEPDSTESDSTESDSTEPDSTEPDPDSTVPDSTEPADAEPEPGSTEPVPDPA
jgi:membrane-bound lytic murein transglycosylase D